MKKTNAAVGKAPVSKEILRRGGLGGFRWGL